jgi:hypothetical protein
MVCYRERPMSELSDEEILAMSYAEHENRSYESSKRVMVKLIREAERDAALTVPTFAARRAAARGEQT